jgi:membrane-associated phospholipid phosphatase
MFRARLYQRMLVGAAALSAASCSIPNSAPSTATNPDANAGIWKTIVISPGTVVVPPPPSSLTSNELATIVERQAKMTPQERASVAAWDSSAAIRWNEVARQLVTENNVNPPMASRTYALLSVAQYDASVTTWDAKYRYNRLAPSAVDSRIVLAGTGTSMPSYPSDHASIAGASAQILRVLFPGNAATIDSLERTHNDSRILGGFNYASDVSVGDSIGRVVADYVLSRATADGSDHVWSGSMPSGDSCWYSHETPAKPPLLPMWGDVAFWVISDMNSVMPSAPPRWNSAEFIAAIREVREISDHRTQGQIDTAKFWADGAGTSTPPGHWNAIACEAMRGMHWTMVRQTRAFALINMAMMDAGVCCWKAKYSYWTIRPSEADSMITTAVPLPNFPSYTSGHASFSAAAARVLGYLIPTRAAEFNGYANAAAISRLYGGIHYRFDSDAGLVSGAKIGDAAIARARADGAD